MSDTKLVDLKQATPLIQRLGELTEAIIASNQRYAYLATDLRDVRRSITDLRSELLSQTNQILTLQHDMMRLLSKDETGDR